MGIRHLDPSLMDMLREFDARLKKLESSQNNAVKKNDIRIGDIVISSHDDTGELVAKNLKSNEVTSFVKVQEQAWSFNGVLSVAGDASDNAPPYRSRHNVVITDILMSLIVPSVDGVDVLFTAGNATLACTLPVASTLSITPANLHLRMNDLAYVTLTGAPGVADRDLTIIARFGIVPA